MRHAIAVVVGLHGVAHLVGFAVPWHLLASPETPYKTTVLSGLVDLGHGGIRAVGVIWLVSALACMLAGSALWEGASWSVPFATAVLLFSLALCLTGLPEARIGVFVNVALLAIFLVPRLASASGLS
jgi:hypothetical protein